MFVTAHNPSTDDLEQTFLSQSYNSGLTSIQVKNNQAFSNNVRILIGDLGIAQSEIVTVNSTPPADGLTLPITATLYSHSANTPIYLLQFDQVQFYRSTNGIGGTYTLVQTFPIDVTNENLITNYDDTTAKSGYYYEVAMYNSLTGVTSAMSDPVPALTGWARNQVGHIIDELLTEMNDPTEENVTRTEILGYINEVNDDLLLHAVRPFNFLKKRIVYSRTAGANSLSYPGINDNNPLMWKFDHMDYNFVDSTTNPVTNNTYTVEVAPSLEYFRNRWISNTSSAIVPQNLTAVLAAGGTLTANKTYFYEVTAVFTNLAESGPSTEIALATVSGFGTINLTWSAAAGAASYNVYRGLSTGGETLLANVTATAYSDTGTSGPGGAPSSQQPPATTQDDMVQEIALNETMQEFDYHPTSRTTANAVWYLYYWTFFVVFLSEGNTIQTPTPRIYKMYVKWAYYLKRSVTEPTYLQMSDRYWQQYLSEKNRLKGHDRRDAGTPRRFEGEGWVRKSYRR